MNPVLQYQKRIKQKKKEKRLDAHSKAKQFQRMKEEKEQEKLDKQDKQIQDPEAYVEPELPQPPPTLPMENEMVKVPGYSQMFSKRQIECNRAYQTHTAQNYDITSKSIAAIKQQETLKKEKAYINSDGVIITDEVLKLFGKGMDPSKIKIGVKQRAQQISTGYDPLTRVTEQMNFDYIKNLQEQKNPTQPPPPPPVEPEVRKKIFLPEERPPKPIQPDVIVKESTVKKPKVDITKLATQFVPQQLLRNTTPINTNQGQVQQPQHPPQVQVQRQNHQDQFREIINVAKQTDKKAELDDFFKEIKKL